ncbi:MAG: aminotransferase class III-fold pyridoxal phosphate-dependent enzyme [Candidatus Latescibacterota bacterium]|jgi:glutamate-1-semialdehyde 2,1-aminomutase
MTTHRVQRSMEIYQRAVRLIPGVTQLISRRPTRAALGVSPIYAERAKGCRIWDVDGNEYVDWYSGIGPIILGYADEVVDAAVKEQIDRGTVFSIVQESGVELAEELVRLIPSAEMVRYAKGGGEACAVAIRIARGFTGRDRVLFCGYHGWHDWYLAANLGHERLDEHLFNGIEPTGVPRASRGPRSPSSTATCRCSRTCSGSTRARLPASSWSRCAPSCRRRGISRGCASWRPGTGWC